MTFEAFETSAAGGRPVELYDFQRGYLHWRYTSAQADVFADSATWAATPISRTGFEAASELNRSAIKITVPRDNEVADMWRVTAPSEEIGLTLKQYHHGDGETAVLWIGRVVNVDWSGSLATLHLEPGYTGVRRQGLRRRYQRACPHVLYGQLCRLSPSTFRLLSQCDSISGLIIGVQNGSALGATYYTGGYVEWEVASGLYDRRYIVEHSGAYMTLNAVPHTLSLGQAIRVYPGCDHTLATCNTKFGNSANYGGMPYIPIKNPFNGASLF